MSSEKATEEKLSIDTASQNSQTLLHVQDGISFQSHQTFSSDFSSTQGFPGNTRSEESECANQSFPAPPGIRSSSSEANSWSSVESDSLSVKCQLTEEHVEMEVKSSPSEPDPMNNVKTESPTDDFSPPRPDNELQSVQCALSDSIQPQTKDWNTEVPDTSSHRDLAKSQNKNLNQQPSVPLQPSNSHPTENTKEETHILQCTTGHGEKQQIPLTGKLFGPYNKEV